jgi:hypothetical protein
LAIAFGCVLSQRLATCLQQEQKQLGSVLGSSSSSSSSRLLSSSNHHYKVLHLLGPYDYGTFVRSIMAAGRPASGGHDDPWSTVTVGKGVACVLVAR